MLQKTCGEGETTGKRQAGAIKMADDPRPHSSTGVAVIDLSQEDELAEDVAAPPPVPPTAACDDASRGSCVEKPVDLEDESQVQTFMTSGYITVARLQID